MFLPAPLHIGHVTYFLHSVCAILLQIYIGVRKYVKNYVLHKKIRLFENCRNLSALLSVSKCPF